MFPFLCVHNARFLTVFFFASCQHDYPDKCKLCSRYFVVGYISMFMCGRVLFFRPELLFLGVLFGHGYLCSSASVPVLLPLSLFSFAVSQRNASTRP